jgi:anti-sigma factor RsiW
MTPERRISEAELHAYLDGELTAEDRAEIEALLTSGAVELDQLRDLRDLNEAIVRRYASLLDAPVPERMKEVLADMPDRVGEELSSSARRSIEAVVAVLIAVLAAAAGYVMRDLTMATRRPETAFVATAIGAHSVYVPEVRHPVEVGAAEESHLVQWLTKRLGANVRAPTLSTLGWKLVGGRLLPDRGLPAAQFMYEDGAGRRLTLYVRKETGLSNAGFQFAERDGFGAFYWVDRPLAYAIAGRLARDELMGLANAVYGQLEQR